MKFSPISLEGAYPAWELAAPPRTDNAVMAELGDETRRLDERIARMIGVFAETAGKRAGLNHDCAVFALACWTNDDLLDVDFSGGRKVEMVPSAGLIRRDDVRASVRTTYVLARSPLIRGPLQEQHLIVKATSDNKEPLYASKLGADGPVVLTTYESIRRAYASTHIGRVSLLRQYISEQ